MNIVCNCLYCSEKKRLIEEGRVIQSTEPNSDILSSTFWDSDLKTILLREKEEGEHTEAGLTFQREKDVLKNTEVVQNDDKESLDHKWALLQVKYV